MPNDKDKVEFEQALAKYVNDAASLMNNENWL